MTDPPFPVANVLFRRHLITATRIGVTADLLFSGAGYAFGPASFTGAHSFDVIRALPISIPAWGWLHLIAAALILGRLPVAGHFLGAVIYGCWGLGFTFQLFVGPVVGWGGPTHLMALAALHGSLAAGAAWDQNVTRGGRTR